MFSKTVDRIIWWQCPWIFLSTLIFYLSITPNPPSAPLFNFPGFDKIAHGLFYFVLSISVFRGFKKIPQDLISHYFMSFGIIFCLIFGLFNEWYQSLIPARTADFWDWAANAVGIIAGTILYIFYKEIIRPNFFEHEVL